MNEVPQTHIDPLTGVPTGQTQVEPPQMDQPDSDRERQKRLTESTGGAPGVEARQADVKMALPASGQAPLLKIGPAALGCGGLAVVMFIVVSVGHLLVHHLTTPDAIAIARSGSLDEVAATDLTALDWQALSQRLQILRERRVQAGNKIEKAWKRHPLVNISGEVHDRDETSLSVWGYAIPMDMSHQFDFGIAMTKSNLHIENFDRHGYMGSFYQGRAYFVRKDEGTNAFGAQVPVLVYSSTKPDEVQSAIDEAARLDKLIADASH